MCIFCLFLRAALSFQIDFRREKYYNIVGINRRRRKLNTRSTTVRNNARYAGPNVKWNSEKKKKMKRRGIARARVLSAVGRNEQ